MQFCLKVQFVGITQIEIRHFINAGISMLIAKKTVIRFM